jgi:molecular chaperone GrpE
MSVETKKDLDGETASEQPEQPSSESEIAALREQLESKEIEAKNNYDRFLRQAAEFENYKKRTSRDRDDAVRFAKESVIRDLLPILDNLERALAHASGGGDGKPLVEGVEMVLRSLVDTLAKHGVTQISAAGQPFDPAKHEAMAQVETDAHEPNSVVEELHKGYMLSERLLRPALVTVAKPAKTQGKKNPETQVENGSSDD